MSCTNDWDLNQFLIDFPQFSDVNTYPSEMINFWDNYSSLFFNQRRWGKFYLTGRALLLAHNLTLAHQNGKIKGLMTDKSVDSVSAGFDVKTLTMQNAALFNGTVYGIQYFQLVQLVGARPLII